MTNIDVDSLGQPSAPAVSFITLGCAKNEVDTAEMVKRVCAAGFRVVDEVERADVAIVNTCSFIRAATEESLAAIFEVGALSGYDDGSKKIIVAGCMPARYGADLEGELVEASAFVPCSREDDIVDALQKVLGTSAGGSHRPALPWASSPAAYVKISDGCDRFCAFSAIPFIRGGYRSFPLDEVRAAVQERIDQGVREITLIAQDTGRWGEDFAEPDTAAHLLAVLAEEHPDTWFRLMYIEPSGVTDDLLDAIASHPNICDYLDVPLQHASPRVLAAMNRSGSAQEHLDLIARIRAKVPGITLRTTVIAGFPGETDDEFQELLSFLEEAEFDYVGAFAYSPEEGTKAAELPDQIDEDVKADRLQEVRDLADAIGCARVAARIGSVRDVLVLGREEDGQLFGRPMCQAPEVDGVTYIDEGDIGSIVSVTIEDTLLYEMEGA